MVASQAYPSLERKPGGPDNWVERVGGLPSYIARIAKHLHYEKGMSISRSIAVAVNTVKRWARAGKVAKHGSKEHVSPKTVALAQAAVAEWEAKKTSGKLSLSAILSADLIDLTEAAVDFSALAKRANAIADPVAKVAARERIIDLALLQPPAGKCKFCDNPGTKRILFAEGKAYMDVCDKHFEEGKNKAERVTPDGTRDPSNISRVADLSNVLDFALTKDGRKSFKNRGKWKHGFIPVDKEAKLAKAKGSPKAMVRMNRLFGRSTSGSTTTNPRSGGFKKEGGGAEAVNSVGQSLRARIRNASTTQRTAPKSVANRGEISKRSATPWNEIPEADKTIRNGKRYVLTSFKGQQTLTEYTGPSGHDVDTDATTTRRFGSVDAVALDKYSPGELRKLLDVPGQPKAVRAAIRKAMLTKQLKAKKR